MANYINKTILSESYAHINVVELTAEEKIEFEMDIKTYQAPRAKRMLGIDIEPVVRTEDGSLKVYLTVYGSLSDALGDFDDFRDALQNLYMSSKMVADACNLESLFLSGASKKQLIRAEARTGVVKATRELFDLSTYLAESRDKYSHKKLSLLIADLDRKVTTLNKNLTFAKDRLMVWREIHPLAKKIPANIHNLQQSPDEEFQKTNKANVLETSNRIFGYIKSSLADVEAEEL
ncbi:hypothetical protein P9875_08050 [Janthinobacterium rivuli]|uniref:Uncharacterized protein n=1 Tax=Janthinobacterium rivuli TaxID=2751478 RepID=A0ABY8I856_9BURK|nr:hypothetical protein [Janthinobacterium rivuli]WFR81108.1 hypothetical protein P9875_08050 [Janthinobacterium rivuli]